ncbi:Lcl domain-containing protein [Paucibacter soli]|uniref:Lcl domain-containing protein n=1 Tax=Paucibacter soli TaxID=3133433 RepID=UPI0030A118F5
MYKNKQTGHAAAMVKHGLGACLALAALGAQASLQGRDLDPSQAGFEAYYDTELKITWLADLGFITHSGFDADGKVSWARAQSWIAGLNASKLYGYDNWRLPKVTPVNGSFFQYGQTNNGSTDVGVAATGRGWGKASEMGHLYYVTLGNKGSCEPTALGNDVCIAPPDWQQKNTGPFTGQQTFVYWSGSGVPGAANQDLAWYFYAYNGNQAVWNKSAEYSALAVRDGDVLSAVPESSSLVLMLAGLSLLALRRRRLAATAQP